MNKLVYIVSFLLLFAEFSWSQSDRNFVYWQHAIGAQGVDELNDKVHDDQGNFYVVGSTQPAGSQSMDILVEKYSENGIKIWSRVIGESGDDRGVAIELVDDQLFIVASSNSSQGIFAGGSGREDIVLLQLNSSGELISMSRYGGNLSDIPSDISKTSNGHLLISAHSDSKEGFLNENYGQSDLWVFRVSAQGGLIWKKNYGGSDEDFSTKIEELPNGEIVLFGHSSSYDGDMALNYGDFDLSLFKLSSTGTILWEQNYGGMQSEIGVDLLIKENSEIVLAGNTLSLSYDVSKNAGFSDAWVLEINPVNGGIVWEETHGSESSDYASALALNQNKELFLMGTTNATFFNDEQSAGSQDAWLAKVNSPESIEHLALFGGDNFETVSDFNIEADGSILLIGTSNSNNDLFSNNHGKTDGWLMKIELDDDLGTTLVKTVSAHPNPTSGTVYLNNLNDSDEILVYNSIGQLVDSFKASSFSQVLDLTNFYPGVYLVKIERTSNSELIRLVRN